MNNSNKFQRDLYVQTLVIILEKLRIPFEFIDDHDLKFNIHIVRNQSIDTTDMTINDIDDIITRILTK